jgi:hypothetical protein
MKWIVVPKSCSFHSLYNTKEETSQGHVILKHEEINKESFAYKYSTQTVKKEKR